MFNRRSKLIDYSYPLIVLFCGLCFFPLSIMGWKLQTIPGGMGDARLQVYILEHGYQWLTGQVPSYWNAPFFYPAKNVMAYSDTHLGSLPVYAFFRLVGATRDTAFQLWILTLFCLNYGSAVLSLRLLRFSLPISAVAAYGFAFSLPLVTQVAHIQLLEVFCVPIVIACLLRTLEQGDTKFLAVTAAAFVWAMYCSVYIGYFLTIVSVGILAAKLILCWISLPKPIWKAVLASAQQTSIPVAIAAGSVGICFLPLYFSYGSGFATAGGQATSAVLQMIPRWQSFLLPYQNSFVWSWLNGLAVNVPHSWEHHLFPGIVILASTCWAVCSIRGIAQANQNAACAALALAFVAPFVLMWGSVSPYELIMAVFPPASAFRAVSRIIFVYLFPMCICLAYLLTVLSERLQSERRRHSMLAICGVLLFVDLSFPPAGLGYDRTASQARVQQITAALPANRHNLVLAHIPVMPDSTHQDEHHVDAMLAAQESGIATVNGLSGKYPPGYSFDLVQGFSGIRAWIGQNRAAGADFSNLFVNGRKPASVAFGTTCSGVVADRQAAIKSPSALAVYAGDSITVPIEIVNKGSSKWCSEADSTGLRNVGVASRWLTANAKEVVGYQHMTPIPGDMDGAGRSAMRQLIVAPKTPGRYIVELRALQQGVVFFDTSGGSMTVQVIAAPAQLAPMGMNPRLDFDGCSLRAQATPDSLSVKDADGMFEGAPGLLVEAFNRSKTWWCAPSGQADIESVGLAARGSGEGNVPSSGAVPYPLLYDVPPGGRALIPVRNPKPSGELFLADKNGNPLPGQGDKFLRIP